MNILFVDHYDSFSHLLSDKIKKNIPQAKITMLRCHAIKLFKIKYDLLLLSPGPMDVQSSGYSLELLKKNTKPVLGVCLGLQIINEYLGGKTKKSSLPIHGQSVAIEAENHPVFKNLPTPFFAARYNSLNVKCDQVTTSVIAWQRGWRKEVMAITAKNKKLLGLQFHPESFLTPLGDMIIKNAFDFLLGE